MTAPLPFPPRAVLLDLDGTLVDSRRDLSTGVNLLLSELGLRELPMEEVMAFVGRGARSLVRRCMDVVDPEQTVPRDEEILRRFLGHYSGVLLDHTRPFDGVVEGLQELEDAGLPLAVVSNKPEVPTLRVVDGLGLTSFFGAVLGGDTAPTKKPDPAPLQLAAQRLEVDLSTCIMVGDSDVDIQAAQAAGIPGVWCAWGGIHPDRPHQTKWEASSFSELVAAILGPV